VTVPRVINEEMRTYYERRVPDYDDWWLGTGKFEERDRPGWSEEVERLVGIVNGGSHRSSTTAAGSSR
jgi:hypothetical protein